LKVLNYNKNKIDLSKLRFLPGEWIGIYDELESKKFLGFIDPFQTKTSQIITFVKIINDTEMSELEKEDEESIVQYFLENQIEKSIQLRLKHFSLETSKRIVFGAQDSLPGLTIDQYDNCVIMKISKLGMYRYRDLIINFISHKFKNKKVFCLYENIEFEKYQSLPESQNTFDIEYIELHENGIKIQIPFKLFQKLGHYFDHRKNRMKLIQILREMNISSGNALDLFCYNGIWGLQLARHGIQNITLVDQGDFQDLIKKNFSLNNLNVSYEVLRKDVFQFLDQCIQENQTYSIIVSDPPAFTKSYKNKESAIIGYKKLHQKIIKIAKRNAIISINSCTQYINLLELDLTFSEMVKKLGRSCQLLDFGFQDLDHPISSFSDSGNYLKSIIYQLD
jgi:23S rRNA (cytosine1962-C5)-methyltransferase